MNETVQCKVTDSGDSEMQDEALTYRISGLSIDPCGCVCLSKRASKLSTGLGRISDNLAFISDRYPQQLLVLL